MPRDYADQFEDMQERVFSPHHGFKSIKEINAIDFNDAVDRLLDATISEIESNILVRTVLTLYRMARLFLRLFVLFDLSYGDVITRMKGIPAQKTKRKVRLYLSVFTADKNVLSTNGSAPGLFKKGEELGIGIQLYIPPSWLGEKVTLQKREKMRAAIVGTLRHELAHAQIERGSEAGWSAREKEEQQAYFRMPSEFDPNVMLMVALIKALPADEQKSARISRMASNETDQMIIDAYEHEPYRSEFVKRVSTRLGWKVRW